jgi:predicted DNA-binding transcriptional regulator AlpA
MAAPVKTEPSTQNLDALTGRAYVSAATLAAMLDTSTASIWRWSKSGRLPKPHKLGAGSTRWRVEEVRAALAKLAA